MFYLLLSPLKTMESELCMRKTTFVSLNYKKVKNLRLRLGLRLH